MALIILRIDDILIVLKTNKFYDSNLYELISRMFCENYNFISSFCFFLLINLIFQYFDEKP